MAKIIDGEEYLTATEVIEEVGTNRQSFYANMKPYLRPYRFGARKSPYYLKREVLAFSKGKPERQASIVISEIFSNWTKHLSGLGYNAETTMTAVTFDSLPEEAGDAFGLPDGGNFVKRSRRTLANGAPIAIWSTYYPLQFVGDIIPQIKQDTIDDIVQYIKDTHGVVVKKTKERDESRVTTLEELNSFQLTNDEPILVVHRIALTEDEKTLIFYTHMTLLGRWFVIGHEHEIHNWD